MAYDIEDLKKKALQAIKKHGLIYIEEVVSFLPCSKKTFYEHKLHESNDIKEAIEKGKIEKKAQLRKNWKNSENATLNLALYKLLSNDDELEKLNNNRQKIDLKVSEKQKTDEEIQAMIEEFEKRKRQLDD